MNETALQYCAYHTLATCSFQSVSRNFLIPFQAIGTFASLLTEAESLEREGLLRRRLLMTLSFEEQDAALHPKVQATDTLSRFGHAHPGLYG